MAAKPTARTIGVQAIALPSKVKARGASTPVRMKNEIARIVKSAAAIAPFGDESFRDRAANAAKPNPSGRRERKMRWSPTSRSTRRFESNSGR